MRYSYLKKLPNFPCLSCPFFKPIEDNGDTFPFCTIYGNQDGCGLESCQEIATYIIENGNKELFLKEMKKHKVILNY